MAAPRAAPGRPRGVRLPRRLLQIGRAADVDLGLPWILADRVAAGTPPFAIVGVDAGLASDRIALLGVSVGGYGALLTAGNRPVPSTT
jgi:hypothetical protein